MGFTAVGISPTTVTTDQQAPLGFKLTVPNGDKGAQEWTYVKTSAELTVGEVGCRIHNAAISDPYIVGVGTVNTTRAAAVGVAQHTIASGSYGFVLSSGVGSVMANGSVTQGADIVPAAAGEVTDFTNGEEERVIGQAFATDAGTTIVLAMLDCGK